MADASGLEGFGAADPAFLAEPQPGYRALRDGGVQTMPTDAGTIIADHGAVVAALRDHEAFSSSMEAIDIGQVRPLIPLQVDPPDHVKFRRLLDPLFAPRAVAKLEPDVRALVNDLIDGFAPTGAVELNAAFAIPLPCTVFLSLLGLPYEDLDVFLEMKDGIIRPPGADRDEMVVHQRATGQRIYDYFAPVVAARRAEPRDDLISGFVASEIDGDRLTDEDILDICYLFLLAGLDTVTASLGCAVTYLAKHPDHRDALVADPALVPSAVEELLRWETPVPGVPRITTRDVRVGDETLVRGTTVICLLGAADLDTTEFVDADTVDLARQPNRHLAFGAGVHRCLGSHLARLELRVALEELHRRIPDYRIAEGEEPVYAQGIRSVEYLPLVFTPEATTRA